MLSLIGGSSMAPHLPSMKHSKETLFLAIHDSHCRFGTLDKPKVRRYIQETFSIEVTDVYAWGYLRRLGFSVQMRARRDKGCLA
jgi:hypothetical protein